MVLDLSGRVALVTGGGQGIGRAIALRLAKQGATLALCDLAPTALEVAEAIQAQRGKAQGFQGDVSRTEEVNRVVEQVVAAFGKIDILVNNAGIARDSLLLRMSDSDWDQVLAVNLKGAFLCTRAVLRHMIRQRWGRLINIASVVGLTGNVGQANYAASKAGLVGFTKTVAREVASRGITANAVAPGFIDTEMTRKLRDDLKQEIVKQIPVGRFGSVEDVAQAVLFLASEEASYITGQVLKVDGGMVMF